MPHTPPDADTVHRTLEEVFSHGDYELQPPPESTDAVGDLFEPLFDWLFEPLIKWWRQASGSLPWLDDVLAGVGVGLLLVLLVQIVRLRNRTPNARLPAAIPDVELGPEQLAHRARSAAETGDFVGAARLLLQSCKARLEQAEHRTDRPGITNRELLRRYRASRLAEPLATLVETVDRGWFGGRECTRLDYLSCLAAYEEVAEAAGQRRLSLTPLMAKP